MLRRTSAPSSLKVRAKKDDDTYVLSGTKQFITSGEIAGLMIVFAATESGEQVSVTGRDRVPSH